MRKQELVHLHRLLDEVRCDLVDRGGTSVPADAFDTYHDHSVPPTAVTARKRDHRVAIDRLLAGIEATLDARPPPPNLVSTESESAEAASPR